MQPASDTFWSFTVMLTLWQTVTEGSAEATCALPPSDVRTMALTAMTAFFTRNSLP